MRLLTRCHTDTEYTLISRALRVCKRTRLYYFSGDDRYSNGLRRNRISEHFRALQSLGDIRNSGNTPDRAVTLCMNAIVHQRMNPLFQAQDLQRSDGEGDQYTASGWQTRGPTNPIRRLISIIIMHDHAEFAWKDNERNKTTSAHDVLTDLTSMLTPFIHVYFSSKNSPNRLPSSGLLYCSRHLVFWGRMSLALDTWERTRSSHCGTWVQYVLPLGASTHCKRAGTCVALR